jgi:hypothetical protein
MVTTGLLRHATYMCMLWRSTGGAMLEKDGETHTHMEEDMQDSAFALALPHKQPSQPPQTPGSITK